MTDARFLFVGIIVHGLVAECLNRAPSLIAQHANYVRKVVFPLEVLSVVALCSATFHMGVSIAVLLAPLVAVNGAAPATLPALPFVLPPFMLMTLVV